MYNYLQLYTVGNKFYECFGSISVFSSEYIQGIFYAEGGKAANWWHNDGTGWYYFKDGKKWTGMGRDADGEFYYVNGKYATGEYNGKVYIKGKETNKGYSKVIFIDPGHGGMDSGAFYNGVKEKDLNLQIFNKLKPQLEALGFTVLTSRNTDVDVDFVTKRSEMVNTTNSDFFISIHFNATGKNVNSTIHGIETYYYEYNENYQPKINKQFHNDPIRLYQSERLAKYLQSELIKSTGAVDRGVLRDTFAVLRETAKPAVLVELGYMDNVNELKQIKTDAYQTLLVQGLVNGILKYYNN